MLKKIYILFRNELIGLKFIAVHQVELCNSPDLTGPAIASGVQLMIIQTQMMEIVAKHQTFNTKKQGRP